MLIFLKNGIIGADGVHNLINLNVFSATKKKIRKGKKETLIKKMKTMMGSSSMRKQ